MIDVCLWTNFIILIALLPMQGTIKFFNDQKGFGFIIPESEGQDIFFHITQCDAGYQYPQEGDVVSYEVGEGRDGRPAAVNVQYVGAAAQDAAEATEDAAEEQEEQAEE